MIALHTATKDSKQYKMIVAAKKAHNYYFACQIAKQLSDIIPFSANSIAILPQGVLTPHMAQCLPVRSIILPRTGGTRHTRNMSREQRYKHNPYYLPRMYKNILDIATTIVLIDDIYVSGATLYHLHNLLKPIGKPIYKAVWLRVSD